MSFTKNGKFNYHNGKLKLTHLCFTIPYIDASANRKRDDALKTTQTAYANAANEKTVCVYCASNKIRFIDFGTVNKRLNDKQIVVTEIWMCRNCCREFERLGTLYSPESVNRARLRAAVLSWAGYTAGSLLAYALYFNYLH